MLEVPIFQKTYDFYKSLYGYLLTFPKVHRYSLGLKLDATALEIFELLLIAGNTTSIQKIVALEKASSKLDLLKLLLRLAKDTQSLDNKKYLHLQSFLQEIGRMLGGWIKATKQIT